LLMLRKRLEIINYIKDKIEKRIDQRTDKPNFILYVLRHNDKKGISKEEI
jgi:transcriptional regulator